MLAAIVRHRRSGVDRVSTIAGDIASRDLKRHLQRAYPLAVVATVAPLLGLFGTVIGMIGAFDKISVLGELANPAAFGGDIGKALITTGTGLAIAIAALVLYHWFKSRIGVYGVELEEQVSVLITKWFDTVADGEKRAATP
jgi:biopolymer transport protein ExbB